MKISEKEYLEKKLQVASQILPALLDKIDADAFIADPLKRGSLVYKSNALAESMLKEIGYVIGIPSVKQKLNHDKTSVIDLEQLKKK